AIPRIIDAAKRCGAEAIHPGYGFLSENADFAEAVEVAGLTLVGPPASAMRMMGSKTTARVAAGKVGAPVVPGTTSALASVDDARVVAARVGYPIMLKASGGGGGKGLREVRTEQELESAFSMASSEAASSFKDSALYVEKYIDRPRHIEIQLIGDRFGNMVYLGERECSLQRRHQKVMEECPSPVVDSDLRRRMGETAILIARAAGYWNAGTIEFLVDQERNFYFLEMNTRLQVEHPVTELVSGRDLVHEQIRVAAGQPLSFTQDEVTLRGHAIECRIYAEDPDTGFLPIPGRITGLSTPSGPGVRNDTGIYKGWEVPVHYDPMLAKLAVWAETREEAVNRLARALGEYTIEGVKTSLNFFRSVVLDEDFISGSFDTGYIDRFLARWRDHGSAVGETDACLADLAVIAAVLDSRSRSSDPGRRRSRPESKWKTYGAGGWRQY
ncbi:MAG TPA: biotin carboxylase N-terminal domain-containing protein, partial [Blastocatellia bacterium]|nr:biotin carboxylase N-terminal domain-containing protein [Blastocatellia bacterium]